MLRAGVGQSSQVSTERAVEEAARQAMAQAGVSRADAALVFFTVEHAAHKRELIETLCRVARTDRLVGSSAAGILTACGEVEGAHGVAVLVLSSDNIQIDPFLFTALRGREEPIGYGIARFKRRVADQNSLLALFPDTYNGQAQRLLQAIENETGFVPVVGAGSSENGMAQVTYQLCGDALDTNAVAGVQLAGSIQAFIDITQGCQPITKPMVITKAEKNFIYEIDHRPALEVFARTLKGPLAEDLRRALMYLFVGLPADAKENSVAPGRYVVRNIVGLDPDNGILGVAEEVVEGEAMIFTFRDGQRARDDLNQMLQRQSDTLAGRKPAFGFYFNCCARGRSLYGVPDIDTAYIRQALGDFPLIGFFGGYELAPLGRTNHLFAYTGVLTLVTA
ncbi:MAG: FIST N-terminal domain-containing protein [Alphaproteobacteria bacterium]